MCSDFINDNLRTTWQSSWKQNKTKFETKIDKQVGRICAAEDFNACVGGKESMITSCDWVVSTWHTANKQ